jgi:replicative DNA helicase
MSEPRMILEAQELWDLSWEEIKQRTGTPEIQITSLPALNDKIWGLHRKEFLVLGGRTSQGKSDLALQIASDVVKQGFRVYFFSLEMSEQAIIERLFCNLSMIPNHSLRYEPAKYEQQAKEFRDILEDRKLIITYKIGARIEELYQAIEDLPQADVVILDYIQAVQGMGDKLSIVNDYILKFRQLCVDKNFSGIMVSQINRGSEMTENKRPNLWQLKNSGTLEEHADTVLLGFWEYHYNNEKDFNAYDVIIAKQRNGVTGTVKVKFMPQFSRFEGLEELPIYPIYAGALEKAKEIFSAKEI